MKILAIESSCDETAAAIVENGQKILSNVVVSQIDLFAAYGGVIPEVAARSHLEAILPVIDKAFSDSGLTWDDIDAIAVTHTPGLLGSLLIGTLTARTLAILHNKPLYPVHHLKSHIYANWLRPEQQESVDKGQLTDLSEDSATAEQSLASSRRNGGYDRVPASASPVTTGRGDSRPAEATIAQAVDIAKKSFLPTFPLLSLVISGGHTQILYMPSHNSFKIIGTTYDDAVGECFDKVAKILGLPYPGGPAISKAAKNGDPEKYHFPHPKVKDLDFSFSGLKTAVLRTVQKEVGVGIDFPSSELKNRLSEAEVADFAASFEKTAIDILLEKLSLALKKYPDTKSIVFAGGVSANGLLRKTVENSFSLTKEKSQISEGDHERAQSVAGATRTALRSERLVDDGNLTDFSKAKKNFLPTFFPSPSLSGDNAAMVAAACYFEIESSVKPTDPYSLNILPRSAIN